MSHFLRSVLPLLLDQMEMRPAGTMMMDRTILASDSTRERAPTTASTLSSSPSRSLQKRTVRFSPAPASPRTPSASTSRAPTSVVRNSDSDSDTGASDPAAMDMELEEDPAGIPKPDGEAGRPGRGGYNLQTTLAWSAKRWRDVKGFIRNRVRATLDCSLCFSDQPLQRLHDIRQEAVAKYSFLQEYEDLWAVDDLIRSRLKYEKVALKRKADAKLAEEARAKAKKRFTISLPASRRASE
ncbi:hypothetical protein GGU10DRAFT_380918 [Lentinula aff. detonsa]|uniref:Uncharacterized protein n=1 Tax=Lentinula aff. detonsa TaxID=2804958 RepID=A0AA38L1P6_9AGAR|nr:hypothetical protein GGU10DRAFT_380918 [Lentinula aff. detonsa]